MKPHYTFRPPVTSRGRIEVHKLLREIITQQQLSCEFQPVLNNAKKEIIGFEALIRGPLGSPLYSPISLFDTAIQCGFLYQLDILCRQIAFETFEQSKLDGLLFVNVNPLILANPKYPLGETLKLLEKTSLKPEQVVIEVSERYPIDSADLLQNALQKYRNYGFKVAIDDLGHGYSGLKYWHSIHPDIVKIDHEFIENCQQDQVKRAFLNMICTLGKSTSVQIIAKGVENDAEFNILTDIGITNMQGHYLSEPTEKPITSYPQKLQDNHVVLDDSHSGNTIKPLVTYPTTCGFNAKAGEVYKMLVADPKLQSIPILNGNKPVGLVSRPQLMEKFSNTYAHALYDNNNIEMFMDSTPILLDCNTNLDDASLFITQCSDEQFSHYFIITEEGNYLGLGSSRELLRQITENNMENARYANPLTLLPGNVPIDKEIDAHLRNHQPFKLAYIDIDHFKPFNDVYGYAKGDNLISTLAQIVVNSCNGHNTFVGHIGGDDFIILFRDDHAPAICEQVCQEFEKQSLVYFDQQAINNQGYYATNRQGEPHLFPLVSISIAVVTPDIHRCHSHHEVSLMASEAKKEAKKIAGNSIFYCRRHTITQQNEDTTLACAG